MKENQFQTSLIMLMPIFSSYFIRMLKDNKRFQKLPKSIQTCMDIRIGNHSDSNAIYCAIGETIV